jgi:hypothetical protein
LPITGSVNSADMGGEREDELAEARDDARDDALDETDVDPTGTVLRNDAVEKAEDAAARQDASGD